MSLVDLLADNQGKEFVSGSVYGVVIGIVTSLEDPDGLGRVKLQYPWLDDESESPWARIMSFMAGAGRGAVFRPMVGDECLLLFEHGDMRFPYVIGSVWNGQDAMPSERGEDSDNNIRMIKSRSGHQIILDDTDGSEKIEVIDASGENKITIDTANNAITLTSNQDITLSATSGKITLDAQELEIKSSGATTIESGDSLEVKASSTLDIVGSTVNLN